MLKAHRYSDTGSDGNTLSMLLHKREFISLRLLLFVSCLLGLVNLINNRAMSCLLPLAQVVIFPLIIVIITLPRLEFHHRSKQLLAGATISAIISAIPSFISSVLQGIHYFLLGGREASYVAFGRVVPLLTTSDFLLYIYTEIFLRVLAVLVSAIIGLIVALAIPCRPE